MSDETPKEPLSTLPEVPEPAKAKAPKAKLKLEEKPEYLGQIPGADLLSDEDIAEIRAKAREQVETDRKKQAKEELKGRFLKEERHRSDPNEELIPLTIDLPGFADRIMIDGTVYMQGVTYRFPRNQYNSVVDQLAQSWKHEAQTGGANRDAYRQPRTTALRPGHEGVTTSQLMRV